MSRSGYSDDYGCDDPLALGRYRQAVNMALNGKRGQAFLREMAAALDAMPEKRLLDEVFADGRGCCAMGTVALARGITDRNKLNSAIEPENAAEMLGIAESMAREIAFENDDDFGHRDETPEARWYRMRAWTARQLNDDGHHTVLRENALIAQRSAAYTSERAVSDRHPYMQSHAALQSAAAREALDRYHAALRAEGSAAA